jgi:hypothetical protein
VTVGVDQVDTALAEFERAMERPERDREDGQFDAYEPGAVLSPDDQEVVELLREIDEYEQEHRP